MPDVEVLDLQFMVGNPFSRLETQTSNQRNLAQAVARPARVRMFVRVVGAGEGRLTGANALIFPTHMLEEPTLGFGVALERMPAQGAHPLATAAVGRYVTSDLGLYVGAEMIFRVDSTDSSIVTKFSLTFEGHALRTTAPVGGGL